MAKTTNRFPGESAEYRRARNALLREEVKLRRRLEEVAAQRRALPPGGEVKTDYAFDAWAPDEDDFKSVRLSELFAPGKKSLFLYNFMYPESVDSMSPCPSCTAIIDAIDGTARHLVQRVNFAIVAKAPIARFREHARRRGWSHALLLSSANNTFNRDYLAEDEAGQQFPRARVHAPRAQDPPLLVERAVVCPARARPGFSPRGLHVAAVADARPHARGPR